MIDDLIRFSIRNKLIIGLFTLILLGWGIHSLTKLPIDAVPDITNNQVQVITTAPTLAPQEVERFITYPVEISMTTIPDVVEIRSISRFGLSVVTIVFEDHVDVMLARQFVSERLIEAKENIPDAFGKPEMTPITTGLGEIYQYVLHTKPGYENKYSAMELRTIQDWVVKRQLLGTPGVADVSSFGGYLKQYEVAIDPDRLRSMNLSILDIFNALQNNNQNTGGAYIDKNPNAYFIRGIGLVENLEDVESIVVTTRNGIPILIRDVAEARFGSAIRYGAMTRNAEGEVVGALVLMLKGENSNEVIQNVKARVAQIQKSLPEGVVIEPFLDRSKLVNKAISTVTKNLVEGGLIVIFVLVLLLGNLRAGLVVASVIPLAMLFAIGMMNIVGVSGNLMSLGAIDFGLIVDGAVIIVESIVHRLTGENRFTGNQQLSQKQMDEEVATASVKIRKSAAFGEIIILIVYLPILTLVGIEGKMFKPMAQTVSFAIIGALILSITYVPAMSALCLSKKTIHRANISDKIMAFFHKLYEPALKYSLKTRRLVVATSVALLVLTGIVFSQMGGEFIPTLEEGDFAVETRLPAGSSLSQSVETATQAADILLKNFPEVTEVIGKIGTSEVPTDPMPVESNDMMIILKDKDEWTTADNREDLAEKMQKALSVIPGVEFGFQQPIQMRFNELMTGSRQDVAIKLFGDDLDVLAEKAEEISGLIQNIKGVTDIYTERVTGLPQIMVQLRREKLAQYGLSVTEVNNVLQTAFAGGIAGQVYEGERRFDLVVRLKDSLRNSIEDVAALYVSLPNGSQIPITEVADIEFKEGPMQISREDAKRRISVGFNVRNRDVQSVVEETKEKLDKNLMLDAGYYVTYGGQFENLVEGKKRLALAVPVALALILILLYLTFGSMRQSLLIFTAIPFAAIGGVFALLFRGMPFSISAGVGFIALFGVAVLNGIVLISYLNQLQKEGVSDIYERIMKATYVRLRPVIMTAAVASFGFLPMALSGSEGGEVQRPLATVVIGGLITSTILTLIVIPVLYSYLEKMKRIPNTGKALILLIPIFLCLGYSNAKAQATTPLTLEESVNTALENNPAIQAAALSVESQQALKGTGLNLSKTNFNFNYGEYNSFYQDNSFSLSQEFAFPTVYSNQAKLYRERIEATEFRLAASRNEMIRNVKLTYFTLAFAKEKRAWLIYQDSLYSQFKRAAELRFKTGETAYLEQLAAETRQFQVSNQLYQSEKDILIYENQLNKLLNTGSEYTSTDSLSQYQLTLPDSATVSENPMLRYARQQIEISTAQTKLSKSKLLPDFTIGFTTQTLKGFHNVDGTEQFAGGDHRFQFLTAGLALPLWFKPHTAQIRSAELERQAAEKTFENNKLQLENELFTLLTEYEKLKHMVDFYQETGLKQSELMIQFSEKSYKEGEIGYIEFLQNISQALDLRFSYLETLYQLNQTSINLEYILGGNK